MIKSDILDNGLCLLTESMPDVRSISLGAWLTRGSRDEGEGKGNSGIAHFTEHMLFKGTTRRSAEEIAQQVDSIGGQLDAFTAKECASYYIKILDEHLPQAVDLLSDLLLRPAFKSVDVDRERKVIQEEIKMVEDIPDELVHELYTETFWPNHSLGRPILGSVDSINEITSESLRHFFDQTYVAENLVVAVAGHLEHSSVRDLIENAFSDLSSRETVDDTVVPIAKPGLHVCVKDIEQSHLCIGLEGYSQVDDKRYSSYVFNTVLGGSMSSRLFQNIREKRGLAYAVNSGLESYRDVGLLTIYAGCDSASVREVVDLVIAELSALKTSLVSDSELQRAKDHLKGNLVLGLESTASRMAQLARSEIYFGRQIDLSENLKNLDKVTAEDIRCVANDFFKKDRLAVTILGPESDPVLSVN
tara:strand:- start:10262 stop:11512 length:1251 start_codon:yes stop_codon:yes gene_type:complete